MFLTDHTATRACYIHSALALTHYGEAALTCSRRACANTAPSDGTERKELQYVHIHSHTDTHTHTDSFHTGRCCVPTTGFLIG